jgi:hypothetical protein
MWYFSGVTCSRLLGLGVQEPHIGARVSVGGSVHMHGFVKADNLAPSLPKTCHT